MPVKEQKPEREHGGKARQQKGPMTAKEQRPEREHGGKARQQAEPLTVKGQKPDREHGGKREQQAELCPYARDCGACQLLGMPYYRQLEKKQKLVSDLLKPFGPVAPVTGMENPFHYRNKVHAVFGRDRKGRTICGTYQEGTHRIVPVRSCLIENETADAIIRDIRELAISFRYKIYDEDTGYGLLRHVLVRTAHATGQVLVALVLRSPILPSRNHFVKALLGLHPEITTIIINVNDRNTSMVLGEKETVIYGKGYIEDVLCGLRFRITSRSFYQVNPVQTEKLYRKAIELAGLTGKERVIDAYCGIGTIGILAAGHAGQVTGVEMNPDAVRNARKNASVNKAENIQFFQKDAGEFMSRMAAAGEHADVVFMDPPRSGSSREFLDALSALRPSRIVYISCGPESLARDLKVLTSNGWKMEGAWPFDMFCQTTHVETVVCMGNKNVKPKDYVEIGIDAEDYYSIKGSK